MGAFALSEWRTRAWRHILILASENAGPHVVFEHVAKRWVVNVVRGVDFLNINLTLKTVIFAQDTL